MAPTATLYRNVVAHNTKFKTYFFFRKPTVYILGHETLVCTVCLTMFYQFVIVLLYWARINDRWLAVLRMLNLFELWEKGPLKTKDRQFDNFVVTGGTVMTIYDATSDNKVVKLTILRFQCL